MPQGEVRRGDFVVSDDPSRLDLTAILARVITDRTTFAYLCDVYVLEEYQGQGLGRWMMEYVMAHPELQGLRRSPP